MADNNFNSMQANLGLVPGQPAPALPMAPSPAENAARASAQNAAQLAYGSQMLAESGVPSLTSYFSNQYAQQLSTIQSQQSFNPYIAEALSGGTFGGMTGGGMMPSPLLMTPPSSGAFRPRMGMGTAPIPPMAITSMIQTPFTPQLPMPMFRPAWEQEMEQREQRADMLYSAAQQAPRAGGMSMGFGAAALAGAAVGARFGPLGAAIGAVGGAAAGGMSGAVGAVGDLFAAPFYPSSDIQQMGAALQRSTQSFVVGGGQLGPRGMGLSREGSLELGGQLRSLSVEPGFKRDTGGMFNREDLMGIVSKGGQAGLFDMEQSTDQIKNRVRNVAQTLKRFMELTNDPDVSSVLRQMGNLQQMGFSLPEMDRAASGMRMYSRAAGMSIRGLSQMGGMPGAMTYQQAGLSPAAGFEYGEYSLASARQSVAGGGISPRQLALLGGVSGMAQRNMQGQAAMMSMPLMAGAVGQYGAGGWGMNYANLAGQMNGSGGMGAADMVTGAVRNLGQAVQQGGVGALALFPLQQRALQDQAASAMNPEQQTMMRYTMAMQTGGMFGLKGAAGFAMGAQALFGKEQAEQMIMDAPTRFRADRQSFANRQDELASRQRQDIEARAPGSMTLIGRRLGYEGFLGRDIAEGAETIGRGVLNVAGGISRAVEDAQGYQQGRVRYRPNQIERVGSEEERRSLLRDNNLMSGSPGTSGPVGPKNYSYTSAGQAWRIMNPEYQGSVRASNMITSALGLRSIGISGDATLGSALTSNRPGDVGGIVDAAVRKTSELASMLSDNGKDSVTNMGMGAAALREIFPKMSAEEANKAMERAGGYAAATLRQKDFATGVNQFRLGNNGEVIEVREAIINSLVSGGMDRNAARAGVAKLAKNPLALANTGRGVLGKAGHDASGATVIDAAKTLTKGVHGEALRSTTEAIAKLSEDQVTTLEKKGGLFHDTFTVLGQKGIAKTVRSLERSFTPLEFTAMTVAAITDNMPGDKKAGDARTDLQSKRRDSLKKEYMAANPKATAEDFEKWWAEQQKTWERYSGDLDLSRAMGGLGTQLHPTETVGMATTTRKAGQANLLKEGATTLAEHVQFSDSPAYGGLVADISKINQSDPESMRKVMRDIAKVKGIPKAVTEAASKALASGKDADFQSAINLVSSTGAGGGYTTAKQQVTGKEGAIGDQTAKGMEQMQLKFQQMFKDFPAATAKLLAASTLLYDAQQKPPSSGVQQSKPDVYR